MGLAKGRIAPGCGGRISNLLFSPFVGSLFQVYREAKEVGREKVYVTDLALAASSRLPSPFRRHNRTRQPSLILLRHSPKTLLFKKSPLHLTCQFPPQKKQNIELHFFFEKLKTLSYYWTVLHLILTLMTSFYLNSLFRILNLRL